MRLIKLIKKVGQYINIHIQTCILEAEVQHFLGSEKICTLNILQFYIGIAWAFGIGTNQSGG